MWRAGAWLGILAAIAASAPARADIQDLGPAAQLKPGESAFWSGPMVERSGQAMGGIPPQPNSPAIGSVHCGLPVYQCFSYELTLTRGAERLRVALDHPDWTDVFGFELRAPDGMTAAAASGASVAVIGNGMHSAEAFVDAPRAGRWRVIVIAHDVAASAFRMRAKLEKRLGSPADNRARDLLPNLQANPPSRVGFAGCLPTEQSQHDATVCLRFAQGPQNVGDGPLLLTVRDVGEPREDPSPLVRDPSPVHLVSLFGQQYQVILRSDGSSYEVPAGEFEYHVQHGHYHHSGTGDFELLRVVDAKRGVVETVGSGPKQGMCMGDYFIAHWRAFDNAPSRTEDSYVDPRTHCAFPVPGQTQMRLSAGWGDVYPESIEGQYVEFGDNGPGLYLIRTTTMPAHDIVESDYTDNTGYALIKVSGDRDTGEDLKVTVLERALGRGPWDPERVLVDDGRQPTPDAPKTVD